jgi:membrane protein
MEGTAESSLSSVPSLWKLGGLTPLQLTRLAIKKIGSDELGTRSAALSYYFILALFPMLLFLVSVVGIFAGHASHFRDTILNAVGRLAPGSASNLIHHVVDETFKSGSGIKVAFGIIGALWAASGGMSAIIGSLNVIYRTPETRPWWKQKLTVIGLTLALAGLIIVALFLVLYGGKLGESLANQVGLGSAFEVGWNVLQWPVAFAAMLFSYSIVY